MATPKETVWPLDPHTAAKHDILRRYLSAWFPILSSHHGRVVYIDGFAGPGRYANGEPGSPLIALDEATQTRNVTLGEIVFWFVEERADRLDNLQSELDGINIPSNFKVRPECGRFHERFQEMLDSIQNSGSQLAPTFAFIDPFGFSGIPFSLVKALLQQRSCEIFITFMADSFNRFLEHPKDPVVAHIVEAFGDDAAIKIAQAGGNRIQNLRNLYQKKLLTVAKYVRYFEMRDRNNRTQYYLFFATNHARGHLKMKEAMWKADPQGTFRFSDATNPNQMALLENDPTLELEALLQSRFQGTGSVTGARVRQFVEEETSYLKSHMSRALKSAEANGQITVDSLKTDEKKRRANTFPDEVRLKWH